MARIKGTVGTSRGFSKAIGKWNQETLQRSEDAFKNGLLDFYDELADATPVLTGNLRNSLGVNINGAGDTAVVTGPGNTSADSTFRGGASTAIANIMQVKLGDRVQFLYGATYARRLNNGFFGADRLGRVYSQPGRFWIERVGARYRSIMRAAASRLRIAAK